MKILVTGGCGFIGSSLIKLLLKNKNNLVLNIDRCSKYSVPESLNTINKKNYKLYKFDICNYNKLKKIIFNFKPNKIIHLAAESHVDRSIKNPLNFINSNILGTYNLLRVFNEYIKIKKKYNKSVLLHVSTDEVYGSLNKYQKPFDEKSNYAPNSPYSASKASSDFLARSWRITYNLPIIITHCSNNYGPWQHPEKLIPLTIYKAYHNQKIPVYGNGKNIRDWIYVEDHVRALTLIMNKGKIGQVYNIGAKKELKNIIIIKKICEILDKKIPKKKKHYSLIKFVKDRPGHDFRYSLNIKKIEKEFKFKPNNKFNINLENTVGWYLKNITWLKNTYKLSNK